ncbi:hypothetical protein yc1106_01910 [Curvularia clavata]|uniref:FAD/NAD(P)-binding domain-containing protein n=1 Tax=Curvularia clavata TaxID=95742 RepID=A0A9Q8Z1X2_CURCL|nr:hypothetical protein yc1106_01910 [Curvularia clavata]
MTRNLCKPRPAKVLIIGGGYGGLSTAVNLVNLGLGKPQLSGSVSVPELDRKPQTTPEITLIDERDGIFHLMGSPLVQTDSEFARESWLRFKDIELLNRSDVRILQGKANDLDVCNQVLDYTAIDGEKQRLEYDYAVLASGIRRSWPVAPRTMSKDAFLDDTSSQIRNLSAAATIVVLGGGAVGVEMAGEIKRAWPEVAVTLIHRNHSLLSSEPLPEDFKARVLDTLRQSGVQVRLNCGVMQSQQIKTHNGSLKWEVVLSNGDSLLFDERIDTISRVTSDTYVPQRFLADNGALKVLPTLQLKSAKEAQETHFAVGDCISWPGINRAGSALIMGQYAATNIMKLIISKEDMFMGQQSAASESLLACPNFEPMMAISVGDEAVVYAPTTGIASGKKAKDMFIGRGYGIDRCSQYLGLGVD